MMSLVYPKYGVRTTSFPDTIALGKVTFTEIISEDSILVNDFDGEIEIIVFDKEKISKLKANNHLSYGL